MTTNWWHEIVDGLGRWFAVVLPSAIAVVFVTFIVGILRFRSVGRSARWTSELVLGLFDDLRKLSLGRVWALAIHSLKESIRRRVLLVLVIFGLVFLFAGWFLDTAPAAQVKVYVSFVYRTIGMLLFLVAVLVACTGLPADIQRKTIHTVVTKPVLRLEIVLGRFLGVAILCTGILLLMATVSYLYLLRTTGLIGSAGAIDYMQEQIRRYEREGNIRLRDKARDDLQQIVNSLKARVPLYGELTFIDERGQEKEKGVDVGFEVSRRSFIPGATSAYARWYFRGIPVEKFRELNKIPVEFNFEVFRTTRQDVERGVKAELTFRNPYTGYYVLSSTFYVRENYLLRKDFEDNPDTPENEVQQILEGSRGDLIVEVRCLSPDQYLGMAQDDLYILLEEDAGFGTNFFKGVVGVWLQVLIVSALAVTFSTFLSTPVAILATITALICGQFMDFVAGVALGRLQGGGLLESLIRIVTHENLVRDLPDTPWVRVALALDHYFFNRILHGVMLVLPDLNQYGVWVNVAQGFYIDPMLLTSRIVVAIGYLIPFILIGYLMLRSREIAR